MKHTPEEISLCKQVAKRHRKEIKKGDWYNDLNVVGGNLDLCDRNAGFYYRYLNENEKIVPLWTISDCLEFLRERGWFIYFWDEDSHETIIGTVQRKTQYKTHCTKGETPLETCLKAVLAVLEEEE